VVPQGPSPPRGQAYVRRGAKGLQSGPAHPAVSGEGMQAPTARTHSPQESAKVEPQGPSSPIGKECEAPQSALLTLFRLHVRRALPSARMGALGPPSRDTVTGHRHGTSLTY